MTDFETPNIDFSNRDRALQQIWSYVQSFQEQVSFWLRNLDKDSFNEQGLKEITEPITAQIRDVAGNVTELQVTAEGLQSSVADAEGKATTAQQTAAGLSVSVSNLSGEVSTVSATINGLNVTTSGGTTYISGDHIKTGTIEGVDFISSNGAYMPIIEIQSGSVLFGQDHGGFKGDLSFNVSDNLVWLRSYGSVPLKILSGTNMSIDSNGTIYIGASSGYSGNVNIGQSGGTVNINGTLKNNGNAIGTAVFT